MIHYIQNCINTSYYEHTKICKLCALHDHYNFIRSLKMGEPVQNPIHQPIIDAILSGKKWRVQQKPNSECGHPGVRNTAGKCVFCLNMSSPEEDTEQLKRNIAAIDHHIATLTEHRETMRQALQLSEAGYPVGLLRIPSPRAQAVSEGRKWYTPYDPCKHCGVIAERYVANGRCRNCGV